MDRTLAGTVRGRATDASGAPIAGASINQEGSSGATTRTDARGDYQLRIVETNGAKRPFLCVFAKGYAPAIGQVPEEGPDARLNFVMTHGVAVRGKVFAPDGQPARQAKVTLAVEHLRDVQRAGFESTAGYDGSFAFIRAMPGPAKLVVEWPDAPRLEQAIEIPADRPAFNNVVLQLEAPHFVAGHVKDRQGNPVVDAQVHSDDDSTWTEKDGSFRLENLRRGRVDLTVFQVGFRIDTLRRVDVDRSDVDFVVDRVGTAAGRVVDGDTGEPLPSFSLRIVRSWIEPEVASHRDSVSWPRSAVKFEDAQGRFELGEELEHAGNMLLLEVSAAGHAPAFVDRVALQPAPDPDALVVRLWKSVALEGVVVDARDGKPVADANVNFVNDVMPLVYGSDAHSAWRPTARTDTAGRFRLERIPVGTCRLVVGQCDFAIAEDGPIDVSPQGTPSPRTIRLEQGGGLEGVALDAAGRPLARASIKLFHRSPKPSFNQETEADAEGRFTFRHVASGQCQVSRFDRNEEMGQEFAAITCFVTIESDRVRQLRLGSTGGAKVHGTLQFDELAAEPLPKQIFVTLAQDRNGKSTAEDVLFTAFARDGSFEFVGIESGNYVVSAQGLPSPGDSWWRGKSECTVTDGPAAELTINFAPAK